MSTGSTTTKNEPWGPLRHQLKKFYKEAEGLYDQGPLDYYPDSTIAARDPMQEQANRNIGTLAGNYDVSSLQSAIGANEATLRGDYLSPFTNPELRNVGNAAAEDITRSYQRTVAPQIASRFAGSGRSTSGQGGSAEGAAMSASQRDLGQELSQMFSGLYGGAYEAERGRQYNAVGQAGQLNQAQIMSRQQQFAEQGAMSAAGRDEYAYAQLQLNDLVERFNFEQYAPYQALDKYQQYLQSGSQFNRTTNTSKLGTAQYIGMAGSALMPSIGGGGSDMIQPGGLG